MRLILLLAALLIAPFSFAQTYPGVVNGIPVNPGPFSPFPPPYNPYLPSPLGGSTTVAGTASGATVSTSGAVEVATKAGGRVAIPTAVEAGIGRAAIATRALSCTSPVGAVVCAATAAAVAHELLNQPTGVGRYRKCPDGVYSFICKDPNEDKPLQYFWRAWNYPEITGSDPAVVCDTRMKSYLFNGSTGGILGSQTTVAGYPAYQCLATGGSNPPGGTFAEYVFHEDSGTCPTNYTNVSGVCKYSGPASTPVPATQEEVSQSLQEKMNADYEANRRLVEAMRADQEQANRTGGTTPSGFNPYDANTPISVTAPPVTLPKKTDSITEVPKPDGSVDTVKKESQTTVTPQTTGSTAADSKTVYQTSTVITTTVTNNVTNQTSVTNETVNDTAEPTKGLCDLYPDIAACSKLGEAPETPAIPKKEIPVVFNPISFASSASCPAPVTFEMYGARSITWEPFCDVMTKLRPLFLALGAAACAWIFLEGMKSL